MKKFLITAVAAVMASAVCSAENTSEKPEGWGDTVVETYPTTTAVFYGSGIDLSRKWNICTGNTDGGVEVHFKQEIKPVQNCPGEYVVVRRYTYPDGTLIKQSLQRLSEGSVPI